MLSTAAFAVTLVYAQIMDREQIKERIKLLIRDAAHQGQLLSEKASQYYESPEFDRLLDRVVGTAEKVVRIPTDVRSRYLPLKSKNQKAAYAGAIILIALGILAAKRGALGPKGLAVHKAVARAMSLVNFDRFRI